MLWPLTSVEISFEIRAITLPLLADTDDPSSLWSCSDLRIHCVQ